jgi:2-oxoglutarate ferredoxin oxidoreductase subunit beta
MTSPAAGGAASAGNAPLQPRDYKSALKPIWCPGCGDFAVLNAITKALAHLALPLEDVALITGIGCSSRIAGYTGVYGFHGVHGRALPMASGLKAARPDITVLVAGGDGDGLSIGGNHFLHACRRNLDLAYIVMDNQVYGMTKGQASPTTAADWADSKLTPHGTGLVPFQPTALALSAGASFVARGFTGDPNGLAKMLVEAIRHPGFSLVHVLSPCPTFRPEQMDWKKVVRSFEVEETHDALEAMQRVQADDGMSTGFIYRDRRPPWTPARGAATGDLSRLEKELQL